MFKDDYKNALDNIKPDGYIKQKVLKQIENTENIKKPVSKMKVIRRITAIAACFAIAVSMTVIYSHNNDDAVNISDKSYSEIYSAVKTFIPSEQSFVDKLEGFVTVDKDAVVEEYEYVEDIAVGGSANKGSVATNINAQKETTDDGAGAENTTNTHSETTTQVEGVSEADIVKTDGEYIYYLNPEKGVLRIIKAGKSPKLMSYTTVISADFSNVGEMFLVGKKIVILGTNYTSEKCKTVVKIYSVEKPEKPEVLYNCEQSGTYNNSRMIGDKLYLISDYSLNTQKIEADNPETYVPSIVCGNYSGAVKAETVTVNDVCSRPEYTVICGYSVTSGKLLSSRSLLGGIETLYCSTQNIIIAGYVKNDVTAISRYAINDGQIELKCTTEIKGTLLNQFSIDEYKGNFRFVTTINNAIKRKSSNGYVYEEIVTNNALFVLNDKLKQIGAIENIAPDERVYSVRFMGDTAYFVTFRQVDPLFSVDLSDPEKPKIIGALKIPGFSNYLFPYGEGKLLGIGQDADERTGKTGNVKLSMFDISDPANVTESAKELLSQDYSEALHNHKAILADYGKNLICFSTSDYTDNRYMVYEFTQGDFRKLAEINLGGTYSQIRGLYIGNEFYIIADSYILVYDINTFSKITQMYLNG